MTYFLYYPSYMYSMFFQLCKYLCMYIYYFMLRRIAVECVNNLFCFV